MTFNINSFKAQLTGGGARATLFRVTVQNPVSFAADEKLTWTAKSSVIPGSQLGDSPVPYMGRMIHMAGDREYDPWRMTVINDEDFLVRNELERWHYAINRPVRNIRDFSSSNPALYKSTAMVHQYSKVDDVNPIRTWKLSGLWPAQIEEIAVSWEDQNRIQEFSCVFRYDYFEIVGGNTGNMGGS